MNEQIRCCVAVESRVGGEKNVLLHSIFMQLPAGTEVVHVHSCEQTYNNYI